MKEEYGNLGGNDSLETKAREATQDPVQCKGPAFSLTTPSAK